MRVRRKVCNICNYANQVLYRCRYQGSNNWVFICGKCLYKVKTRYKKSYQYGGTWKSKKTSKK